MDWPAVNWMSVAIVGIQDASNSFAANRKQFSLVQNDNVNCKTLDSTLHCPRYQIIQSLRFTSHYSFTANLMWCLPCCCPSFHSIPIAIPIFFHFFVIFQFTIEFFVTHTHIQTNTIISGWLLFNWWNRKMMEMKKKIDKKIEKNLQN